MKHYKTETNRTSQTIFWAWNEEKKNKSRQASAAVFCKYVSYEIEQLASWAVIYLLMSSVSRTGVSWTWPVVSCYFCLEICVLSCLLGFNIDSFLLMFEDFYIWDLTCHSLEWLCCWEIKIFPLIFCKVLFLEENKKKNLILTHSVWGCSMWTWKWLIFGSLFLWKVENCKPGKTSLFLQ